MRELDSGKASLNPFGGAKVHKGIHGIAAEFIAKHVSEGVIELYTKEEKGQLKQYIRVSKMCLTKFDSSKIEYTLGEEGIVAIPKL